MPDTKPDPVSVWQGELNLLGVTLHVHVLDNGQRIIEADDMYAFMEAMASGAEVDQDEAAAFARWMHGLEMPDD